MIESMDACFGLVRKKSAGKSSLPPRHSLTMFANQEDVDEFVDNYTASAKQTETVSEAKLSLHAKSCVYCILLFKTVYLCS